ncbi:hypothetical protein BDZ94DRAFT_1304144 [Collybia nuda]|uniref:Uncharacterized protein n=1 Tax=Collybia nuda TaxID=64659 RepID=A0A9P5YHC3_9AGAR|nr:hypothetical protein BDZ94DRAFT_1304144 [Collybia nuda]
MANEVKLVAGVATNHGFHQYHYDLDKFQIYLPLSLFTNTNLAAINHESASLTLQKINPTASWNKPPQVLNTEVFEKKHGRETELTHQSWIEAACNFVPFAANTGKDGTSGDWCKCWDQHFGFFESCPDAVNSFPAILELDI